MTPERLQQIERVYQAARDREPSERAAYVEAICGEDHNLCEQVESLLRHDDSSPDAPLNRPAWLDFGGPESTMDKPAPGTRLGPYEIECALGAGGMGEVFRARDTRLNRHVAIKRLHAQFSDRFEREARAISSLNHPHICTLYDIGPDFLVMELLEGETLASRLKKGPLPIDLILQYAAQIASALAVAHGKGIVHRDLKPGNIMLTRSGVKVLDFGLAKTTEDETLTLGVLGTPAYMSPEQREGRRCDHRTDIYAFGLILREMAAGRRGTTPSAAETPQFKQLVDRCLREDPDDRWQSAGDLANIIEWSRAQSDTSPATSARSKPSADTWKTSLIIGAALILLLAVVVWKGIMPRMAAPSVVRLALALPSEGLVSDPGQLSGPPVISPDGKVVVLALAANGRSALWMRRLDSDRFERLEGTEGSARQPFWSPDGTRIAFFADGKLKKIKMPHGIPETLCELSTETARGGAWSSKGVILFGMNYKGLMRVSENGGDPVLIAGLDDRLKENSLRFPQFLADGNRFIYFSRTLDPQNHAVYLDALDTVGKVPRKKLAASDGPSVLGHDPSSGRDFLVFPKDGQLWEQGFNETDGSLGGEKLAVSDDVGQFSLSATGTLVFRRATSEQSTLTWVNRGGKAAGQIGQPGDYWDIALSPDERHAAVLNHRAREGRSWVEMIDLTRNLQNPFSDPTGRASGLVWSHDSASLYFTSWAEKGSQVLVRRIDSASPAQPVISLPERYDVRSLSSDGRALAADHWLSTNRSGLGLMEEGQQPLKSFESPTASLSRCQFSPDGRWLLYQSYENGVFEIYVSDFPGLSIRRRISASGGTEPRWGRAAEEILYVAPGGLLTSAAIKDPVHLVLASPKTLFRLSGQVAANGGFSYDVARGGGRFLVLNTLPPANARDLSVVVNWPQLMGAEAQH
ncbi:MAG: protein kinase [Bryobacteraceae bacterium]|jgi:Tol biopolymer transport system component/predicted Ser/Thr protein kinase